jgi:lysophospholipase L1-like esterase
MGETLFACIHRAGRRRLLALTTVLCAITAACAAAPAVAAPLRYVALGDSYSAASGVLPPDLTAPIQCLRSTRNYPHVLAGRIGAQLSDVTCGAADTGDYFAAQYPGVPPQLDALHPDTQLVTQTIGGNDSSVFINSIVECGAAGLSTLGQGSPCKDRYGSSFEDTIRTTTYPSLVRALNAVHAKAPQAKVAILGYPWIMPRTVGCFDRMPIAQGDVPYVRGIEATLNDAVRRAAVATGSTYIDMSGVSEGHDACKPIGVRWIEPVLQGTNPVVVHPNALGETNMAAQTMTVLGLR